MTNFEKILNNENPVFSAYAFWSSILIIKMLLMSYLTARVRKAKQVVPNPEDVSFLDDKKKEAQFGDPDVERVRRAHRNDLENCLPLLVIGFFYVLTNPSTFVAVNLFRASVIARIVHTYAYAINPMQPARGIAFGVCGVATLYMAVRCAFFFM